LSCRYHILVEEPGTASLSKEKKKPAWNQN